MKLPHTFITSPPLLQRLPLNKFISQCDECQLKARKGLGVGNVNAPMLLLAQSAGKLPPSNIECLPFDVQKWEERTQCKSGVILQEMLAGAEIPATAFYVTNTYKCEAPVRDTYIENCSDWLEGELLELRRLKLIVALGDVAGRRMGIDRPFRVSLYVSKLNPLRDWIVTRVNHPASPLYPGGISKAEYQRQWQFVGAVLRRLINYGR